MSESHTASVRGAFSRLKAIRSPKALEESTLSIPGGGWLLPVCELHAGDETLIRTFAQWREENFDAFPTQFPVTIEGTRTWLRKRLLDQEDRMLFLVCSPERIPVGHLGYANSVNEAGEMEIDNVVRGIKTGQPGLMGRALERMLSWAVESVAPRSVFLRVFRDNVHAVSFYERFGFVQDAIIPLAKEVRGQTVAYLPVGPNTPRPVAREFLRMRWVGPAPHA